MSKYVNVLFICCLLFFLQNIGILYAQDLTSTKSSTSTSSIDYTYPYPGLLPGHPLYVLKAARDILLGLFISSPAKKAEYDLLQADKHIEASYMLSEQKNRNIDLSVSTLSKGINYFEDANIKAKEAKKEGLEPKDFFKKLTVASFAYQQKISQMEKNVGTKEMKKYAKEKERLVELGKKAK